MSDAMTAHASAAAPGTGVAEAERAQPICRCGAIERHATQAGMCANGHFLGGNNVGTRTQFVQGNQAAFQHGVRRFEQTGAAPADLRQSADDMVAGIIADKGGPENLTTLKREYAQQARNFRVMLDLIGNYLVRNGLITQRGRVRSAVTKYVEVFDRFDKCAQRLGLEREARALTLAQRLAELEPIAAESAGGTEEC